MRNLLITIALVLATATTAFAQRRNELPSFSGTTPEKVSPEDTMAARRRAAGIQDVQRYGMKDAPVDKPIPWVGIAIVLVLAVLAAPFAWMLVRSTRRDLEDQATFGLSKSRGKGTPGKAAARGSHRPPSRSEPEPKANETRVVEAAALERTPRDAIWDVVASAGGGEWMRTDQIASGARLSEAVAADELAALTAEGYLEENRDRSGRPVFKVSA